MPKINGVDDFTAEELAALFSDENQLQSPATEVTEPQASDNDNSSTDDGQKTNDNKPDTTKAFAKRLRESTEKAVTEERARIAKEFGYESYDDMLSARQRKAIEEQGLNPDDVSPIVEKLVNERLANDPRLKDAELVREQRLREFATAELAEITKLTHGEITKLEQIPKNVRELWSKTGSLKSAYLQLEGERLILKAESAQNHGSTSHLNTPAGTAGVPTNERPLTDKEKAIYKMFCPNVTDDELSKKTYKN